MAGRPTRDGAADRSAQVERGTCASQLRCLARGIGGGARGAGHLGGQAVLAQRGELDDEVERGADLLSEPGEHAFDKVRPRSDGTVDFLQLPLQAAGWAGPWAQVVSVSAKIPPSTTVPVRSQVT
jgi:hypothetical protein